LKELMRPTRTLVDTKTGVLDPCDGTIQRKLSDMRGIYADARAYDELLNRSDKLIYKVYEVNIPQKEGQLLYCTSIIYSGKVGNEYFMTKGHFHCKENTAEIYFCLQGEGYLLMQTHDGQVSFIKMRPGSIGYIPPYWGHRTINSGGEKLILLAIYPAEAGHNYKIIEEKGFAKIMVEESGKPVLKKNPKYKSS